VNLSPGEPLSTLTILNVEPHHGNEQKTSGKFVKGVEGVAMEEDEEDAA